MCPEINQERDIASGGVCIKVDGAECDRPGIEQGMTTSPAFSAGSQLFTRDAVGRRTGRAHYQERLASHP
jgi:hypothetical protein